MEKSFPGGSVVKNLLAIAGDLGVIPRWGRSPGVGNKLGFPGGSAGKESACNAGDPIPGWGRSPGEGNGNPLQYSYLGNPMDRGAW